VFCASISEQQINLPAFMCAVMQCSTTREQNELRGADCEFEDQKKEHVKPDGLAMVEKSGPMIPLSK